MFLDLGWKQPPYHKPRCERTPIGSSSRCGAEPRFWGFSFIDTDLAFVRKTLKYGEIRRIFESRGLGFIEIELITDWIATGERRVASDRIRRQLLEAAAELRAHHIKVVGDLAHQFRARVLVHSSTCWSDTGHAPLHEVNPF